VICVCDAQISGPKTNFVLLQASGQFTQSAAGRQQDGSKTAVGFSPRISLIPLTQVCESSLAQQIYFLVHAPTSCCWSYCITVESILIFIPLYQRIAFHTTFSPPNNRVSYGRATPLHTPFCTIWHHTPTSRYPLEIGGTKIKKVIGREFTHLREMDNIKKEAPFRM
jgi:hypothetical protein